MPVYEYYYPYRKNEFELMGPMNEIEEPALCPGCGTRSQSLISPSASRTGSYVRPPGKAAFREKP